MDADAAIVDVGVRVTGSRTIRLRRFDAYGLHLFSLITGGQFAANELAALDVDTRDECVAIAALSVTLLRRRAGADKWGVVNFGGRNGGAADVRDGIGGGHSMDELATSKEVDAYDGRGSIGALSVTFLRGGT